jgi:hypothetical protein
MVGRVSDLPRAVPEYDRIVMECSIVTSGYSYASAYFLSFNVFQVLFYPNYFNRVLSITFTYVSSYSSSSPSISQRNLLYSA